VRGRRATAIGKAASAPRGRPGCLSRERRAGALRSALVMILCASSLAGLAEPLTAFDLHPLSLGTAGALAAVSSDISLGTINSAIHAVPGLGIAGFAGQVLGGRLVYGFAASIAGDFPGAVLWSLLGDGRQLTVSAGGSLALLRRVTVGSLAVYTTGEIHRGFSLDAGARLDWLRLQIGLSARHLASEWLGEGQPLELHLAARLCATESLWLFAGFRLRDREHEMSVGAQTEILGIVLRWGIAFGTASAVSRVGVGFGLATLDVPLDVAIGVRGTPMVPCVSVRAALHAAPWW